MALTIQNATIGYDANEVQSALNNLNTNVIQESKTQLTTKMSELREAVDAVWIGQSADNFKQNMKTDMDAICRALDDIYENTLVAAFNQNTAAMSQIDENLVKVRGGE